jgi:hypothetical protein
MHGIFHDNIIDREADKYTNKSDNSSNFWLSAYRNKQDKQAKGQ